MKFKVLSAIKVAYISAAIAALVFGAAYAYLNLQSQSNTSESKKVPKEESIPWVREAPPETPKKEQVTSQPKEEQPKVLLESSIRVSIPPEVAGLGVIRVEFLPGVVVKEIALDCQPPGRCGVAKEAYRNYIGFSIDSSKVSILQWIVVEGNGNSFNLTSATGFLVDFRIPWRPPDNGTTYYLGKFIGDEQVNHWKEGEQVRVRFGFITAGSRLGVSEQSATVVACKNTAEPTVCNK